MLIEVLRGKEDRSGTQFSHQPLPFASKIVSLPRELVRRSSNVQCPNLSAVNPGVTCRLYPRLGKVTSTRYSADLFLACAPWLAPISFAKRTFLCLHCRFHLLPTRILNPLSVKIAFSHRLRSS